MNGQIGQFENRLERNEEDMYSRKNKGYSRSTANFSYSPPPNYRGVAFSRDYRPEAELHSSGDSEETKARESIALPEQLQENTPENSSTNGQYTDENTDLENASPQSESAKEDSQGSENEQDSVESESGFFSSSLLSKKMSIEDLLIIGAVILFVSGELDGDLLLLLGLLLVAGL